MDIKDVVGGISGEMSNQCY